MISVLIPVFNVDVRPLVSELLPQLENTGVDFEILVVDDASTDADILRQNASVSDFRGVRYLANEVNLGRSKIRNFLVENAKYDLLLLMDCDARVKRADFVSNYVDFFKANSLQDGEFVIAGGVDYRNGVSTKVNNLRYKYGVKREVRSANARNLHPYANFTPFNMFCSKSVIEKCGFDDSLTQYGYEDTFFGLELEQFGIPVFHIDNELYHDGIDSNEVFLRKVSQSCDNLSKLVKEGKISSGFVKHSRLLKTYFKLSSNVFGRLFLGVFRNLDNVFYKSALRRGNLLALDCYKLSQFASYIKK